jgi:hypothetical protein
MDLLDIFVGVLGLCCLKDGCWGRKDLEMYIEGEAQIYCKENFSASPNDSWDLYAWLIGGKQTVSSPRVVEKRESEMLKDITNRS